MSASKIIDWLTPQQVHERTGYHPDTVRRLLENGVLHGHQPGGRKGRWSVNALAVDAWIQGADGKAACGCRRLRRAA